MQGKGVKKRSKKGILFVDDRFYCFMGLQVVYMGCRGALALSKPQQENPQLLPAQRGPSRPQGRAGVVGKSERVQLVVIV